MRPGSQVGPWVGGAPLAGLCQGLDAAGTAGRGRSHCCPGQGRGRPEGAGLGLVRGSWGGAAQAEAEESQPGPASQDSWGWLRGGRDTGGHWALQKPGSPAHRPPLPRQTLETQGLPRSGQPNPDWRPPAPDGGAPSFLPPSTSHSPDLIEGLTLDWGSLPGSLTQEACWHLVSAPKEPPACPASG